RIEAMSTIFIGGSRRIATVPTDIWQQLENIMERLHNVVIGDAPGAGTAVQRYMKVSNYRHVTGFFSDHRCRNNLDNWPTRHIAPLEMPAVSSSMPPRTGPWRMWPVSA